MSSFGYEIEVFYDGGCPLCRREINMLRRADNSNRIRFTDIDDENFNAESVGKSYEQLMAQIHGRLSDGTWVTGVETFRRLYSAIGFRTLVGLSRIPGVSHFLNLVYSVFAKKRLAITGRCSAGQCRVQPSGANHSHD